MISVGDFKKGVTFILNGKPHIIVDFQHVKPGKGAAFVRTKHRNVLTGAIKEESFSPSVKFPKAVIETKEMEYIYNDDEFYYFMDSDTFDQVPLSFDQVEDAIIYLKENTVATLRFFEGRAISVEPPITVILEVTETEPGVKGDTANNVTKPATTETGAVISVPIFVNIGDKIKIDTRTGDYQSRVK